MRWICTPVTLFILINEYSPIVLKPKWQNPMKITFTKPLYQVKTGSASITRNRRAAVVKQNLVDALYVRRWDEANEQLLNQIRLWYMLEGDLYSDTAKSRIWIWIEPCRMKRCACWVIGTFRFIPHLFILQSILSDGGYWMANQIPTGDSLTFWFYHDLEWMGGKYLAEYTSSHNKLKR